MDNSIGLGIHDFKHLQRLIDIGLEDLVTHDSAPIGNSMTAEDRSVMHSYSGSYELSSGPVHKTKKEFLKYSALVIPSEEAKGIIDELETIMLEAIKAVDSFATEREMARCGDIEYDACSLIPHVLARQVRQQKQHSESKTGATSGADSDIVSCAIESSDTTAETRRLLMHLWRFPVGTGRTDWRDCSLHPEFARRRDRRL